MLFSFLVLLVFCGLAFSQDDIANREIFYVEHEIDGAFVPRGQIHLVTKIDGKTGLIFPDKNGIQGSDVESFKRALSSNGLYKLKIRSLNGDPNVPAVLTSIPACELQKSGFKEDLVAFLDKKKNLIGVSYSSPSMTLSRSCDASKIKDQVSFQTRLKLGDSMTAQAIPLNSVGPRPGNVKDVNLGLEEDKNPKQPPQTFLRKYWYIVLLLIMYMIMGGGKEPAPAGKEGQAAPAAAAAGTAPAK